jgi:hypothetical protein
MCFSQGMSGAFAFGGLLMALWLRSSSRFKGTRCAEGVFFFFLMEVRALSAGPQLIGLLAV